MEANADQLDDLGMVLDFGVIKKTLCRWLEDTWDHRFLIWEEDPLLPALKEVSAESLVVIPFNPTAEQIANYLVEEVAPTLLEPYGCRLTHCRVEETRKCSASAFVE